MNEVTINFRTTANIKFMLTSKVVANLDVVLASA